MSDVTHADLRAVEQNITQKVVGVHDRVNEHATQLATFGLRLKQLEDGRGEIVAKLQKQEDAMSEAAAALSKASQELDGVAGRLKLVEDNHGSDGNHGPSTEEGEGEKWLATWFKALTPTNVMLFLILTMAVGIVALNLTDGDNTNNDEVAKQLAELANVAARIEATAAPSVEPTRLPPTSPPDEPVAEPEPAP